MSVNDNGSNIINEYYNEFDSLDENTRKYYDYISNRELNIGIEEKTGNTIKHYFRCLFIGLLLGAVLYGVILYFKDFLFNDCIRQDDNIADIFSVHFLDNVVLSQKKKRFLSFIDEAISRIKNKKSHMSKSED